MTYDERDYPRFEPADALETKKPLPPAPTNPERPHGSPHGGDGAEESHGTEESEGTVRLNRFADADTGDLTDPSDKSDSSDLSDPSDLSDLSDSSDPSDRSDSRPLSPRLGFAPEVAPEAPPPSPFASSPGDVPDTAPPPPSAESPSWWRRWLGPAMPRIYSPREILLHVWREHILWPQAWFHLLLFVLLAVAFWMNAMNYWVGVIDDSYITFRYSDHFIRGLGPVYNIGERVEGFTNFTWMMMIAFVIGLGGDPMFWSKVLGFGCCLASMIGVAYFGGLFSRRRDPWNWIAVVPMAASAHFAHWSMMGMETQLQVALLVWTFARFYREMHDPRAWTLSPLLASLAAMTRIESLYFMTPLAAYAVVQVARGRLDWRRFLRWSFWAAVCFVPYFAWKYWYFGDLAPNTYYAKKVYHLGNDRGVAHLVYWYLGQGAAFKNLWIIPLVMALLWARPVAILILGPLALNVFYVYHVDGDWMPNLRFLQVTVPFLGLLLLLGVRWVQQVLHDWRGGPAPAPGGTNGLAWLLAEVAVFGSWVWLVFIKAAPVFQANDPKNTTTWKIAFTMVVVLLLMRWMSGWDSTRRARRQSEAPGDDLRPPLAPEEPEACPLPAASTRLSRGAPLAKPNYACVAWMGLEWAVFMVAGMLFALMAARLADAATLVRTDWAITLQDLGLRPSDATTSTVEAWRLTVPSSLRVFYVLIGILAAGWTIRILSRGRWARSLVRWPVYAGLALLLLFHTNTQLGLGSVYIFGKDPMVYNRPANFARMQTLKRVMHSGFSPPLQNVADWMLKNSQYGSTIFMSDIGYPMWLNPHMSLIDVDGLVDKVIADAPSARGDNKSGEAYIREEIERAKLARELPKLLVEDIERRVEVLVEAERKRGRFDAPAPDADAETESPAESADPADPAAPTPEDNKKGETKEDAEVAATPEERMERARAQFRERFVREAKLAQALPEDALKHAWRVGGDKYKADRYGRAARYVLERSPEYMNLFKSHTVQGDPKSQGFVYPDVSRAVYNDPEFAETYVHVAALNKYIHSWNHFYRRKDVEVGVSAEERIERWSEGIRRNPRMSYLYRELASTLVESGQPYEGEPRRLLHQAIKTFRGNERFLNELAQWGRQNDEELALKAWRASLAANPNQEWIHRTICEHYLSKDKLDEVLDYTRGLLASRDFRPDSHFLGVLTRVADRARTLENKEMTEATWQLVLRGQPDQEWFYRRIADFYVTDKRLDEAIGAMEAATRHVKSGIGPHFHLAYLYEQAERIDDAVRTLREAAEKDPANTRALMDLGSLLRRKDRLPEAVAAYEQVPVTDPNHAHAARAIRELQARIESESRPTTPPPPAPPSTPPPTAGQRHDDESTPSLPPPPRRRTAPAPAPADSETDYPR